MKRFRDAGIHVTLVMFLLFVNLFMGLFTVDMVGEYSLTEKLYQVFTWQTVLISFVGGVVSLLVTERFK